MQRHREEVSLAQPWMPSLNRARNGRERVDFALLQQRGGMRPGEAIDHGPVLSSIVTFTLIFGVSLVCFFPSPFEPDTWVSGPRRRVFPRSLTLHRDHLPSTRVSMGFKVRDYLAKRPFFFSCTAGLCVVFSLLGDARILGKIHPPQNVPT